MPPAPLFLVMHLVVDPEEDPEEEEDEDPSEDPMDDEDRVEAEGERVVVPELEPPIPRGT